MLSSIVITEMVQIIPQGCGNFNQEMSTSNWRSYLQSEVSYLIAGITYNHRHNLQLEASLLLSLCVVSPLIGWYHSAIDKRDDLDMDVGPHSGAHICTYYAKGLKQTWGVGWK